MTESCFLVIYYEHIRHRSNGFYGTWICRCCFSRHYNFLLARSCWQMSWSILHRHRRSLSSTKTMCYVLCLRLFLYLSVYGRTAYRCLFVAQYHMCTHREQAKPTLNCYRCVRFLWMEHVVAMICNWHSLRAIQTETAKRNKKSLCFSLQSRLRGPWSWA